MFFNYFNMSRQSAGIDHFSLISIDPFLITRLEQSHRQLKKKKKNPIVRGGTPIERTKRIESKTRWRGRWPAYLNDRHSMPHMSASSSTRVCPDSSPCSPRFRVNVQQRCRYTGYRLFGIV